MMRTYFGPATVPREQMLAAALASADAAIEALWDVLEKIYDDV